jgi:hypothetical protein
MQGFLKKHSPEVAHHSVKVSWQREGRKIIIQFSLQKRSSGAWVSNPSFSSEYSKNWGLWDADVVESFLQLRQSPDDVTAPYLEIQVSPRNQPFALIITKPREKYYVPEGLDFKTHVEVGPRTWTAMMEVVLPAELPGEFLYGGFFACLSESPREFYALEPNPEINPDFHRPELFLKLDEQ